MAAAARAPGPADARIPCPLCGGLIHPIAGRCKHCKGDLSALRAARPAAAATLPALASPQHPYVSAAAAPAASPYAPLPAAAAPVGFANAYRAVVAPARGDDSQPILPPRQTGRMPAPAPRASWKSWPVIVIALAVVAIVTAVVLMVWPPGGPKANAGNLAPPPAPERMDTNPLPQGGGGPQGSLDPWNDRNGAAPGQDDPAPTRPTPPTTPPDIDDIPAPSTRDPFASMGKNPMDLVGTIMDRACTRLASCPTFSSTMRATCDLMKQVYPAQPPTCAAAQRCLARFDSVLTCDGDLDAAAVFAMLNGMDDCAEALRC